MKANFNPDRFDPTTWDALAESVIMESPEDEVLVETSSYGASPYGVAHTARLTFDTARKVFIGRAYDLCGIVICQVEHARRFEARDLLTRAFRAQMRERRAA